ncbi:Porphobilinogen deaminase [Smittium culicis]|uniref:hydroxymethylbilane synthase n=1 Tax=Smittium culicis TaxID=133412 RepID=A0A1R1YSL3_9FUNG|nr:Porphobilinogen deaminase [Smittium culicis]
MPPVMPHSKKNSGLPVTLNHQKQETKRLLADSFADRLLESTNTPSIASTNFSDNKKPSLHLPSNSLSSFQSFNDSGSQTPTEKNSFTVGSRKSNLAVVQSEMVIQYLSEAFSKKSFPLVTMSTTGDRVLDVALSKIGEKALFTKELEYALEDKSVDLVVHSLKDLPTVLPEGMEISSILKREDPRDVVIFPSYSRSKYSNLNDLPEGSQIGTSSVRRIAQLSKAFPHLRFLDIRGNLNTRFKKLEDPESGYSAIILAAAGVKRLGFSNIISQYLDDTCMYYAVGQGALAIETRSDDEHTRNVVLKLAHTKTLLECVAERGLMRFLEGGCSIPIGVWSTWIPSESLDDQPSLLLRGVVSSIDGEDRIKAEYSAQIFPQDISINTQFSDLSPESQKLIYSNAENIGYKLGEIMNEMGASRILSNINNKR